MRYGIDSRDNTRKHVDDINEEYERKPFLITCELCGGRLIPKCGEIRAHHFAHCFIGKPTEKQRLCRASSAGLSPEESDWHKRWIGMFPENMRYRRTMYDGKSPDMKNEIYQADIKLEKYPVVVEFQKNEPGRRSSKGSPARRTKFWNECGYKTVWVFDETDTRSGYMTLHEDSSTCTIYTEYLLKLFDRQQLTSKKLEVHFRINGKYYCFYDFGSMDGKTTEAKCLDSYFNCFDADRGKIIDDIEDRMSAYAHWTKNAAAQHKNIHCSFLATLLQTAKKNGKNCIGALNEENGNEYKVSTNQADRTIIQGYFRKKSDGKYMEEKNDIYYAEKPVWKLKWQFPADKA